MYYWKLYKDYLKEVDILKAYIKSLKEESKNTPSNECENLQRRISILYGMYLDMKETTDYLNKRCEVINNEKEMYTPR